MSDPGGKEAQPWKITAGRGAMPSWRHLPEGDRWALVQHVRTLKQ